MGDVTAPAPASLLGLVWTILPTNKKASKVEILQHVIDYIWDLQVELDEPEKSRQLAGSVPRTPLTTLNAELASIAVENGCSDDRIMCR